MSTEWMGRYRTVVGALIKHTNLIGRAGNNPIVLANGVVLSVQEWQVFEYVIEHEEDDDRMMLILERLGIPQSSFSKMATKLSQYDLITKYQTEANRKNVILRPTELGKQLYLEHVSQDTNSFFAPFFEKLKDVDDETLLKFADALNALSDSVQNR